MPRFRIGKLIKLGLIVAAILVIAMAPVSVFAAEGAPPAVAAAAAMAIGTGIAGLVAIIRSAVPTMPGQVVPLVVLTVSALFVIVAAFSAGGDRDPLAILLAVVQNTVSAMGIREGITALVPGAANLPTMRSSPSV